MKKLLFLLFSVFLSSCVPVKNVYQTKVDNENYIRSNAEQLQLYVNTAGRPYVKTPENKKIYTDAVFYYKSRWGEPDYENNYSAFDYEYKILTWYCLYGKSVKVTFKKIYVDSVAVWTPELSNTSDCIK
jgi:hypothetical protein